MQFRDRSHKEDMLRQIPLFRGLSPRHLDEISRHTDEVHVDAGRVLMDEGAQGHELFIIAEGKARVERHGSLLRTLGPGDFIGEMALIDNQPRSATVSAEEPMTLLVVNGREFKPLLESVPGFAEALLKALAARLREASDSLSH